MSKEKPYKIVELSVASPDRLTRFVREEERHSFLPTPSDSHSSCFCCVFIHPEITDFGNRVKESARFCDLKAVKGGTRVVSVIRHPPCDITFVHPSMKARTGVFVRGWENSKALQCDTIEIDCATVVKFAGDRKG
jgi:hypothetical protein